MSVYRILLVHDFYNNIYIFPLFYFLRNSTLYVVTVRTYIVHSYVNAASSL